MDVIILGGGIVGLTVANLLATNSNLNIGLIEANYPALSWDKSVYDLRCSAITRATQNVFNYLGVWDEIIAERVGVYDKMLVWDKNDHARINFVAQEVFEENLGHIVENRLIQSALWKKALASNNIRFINAKPHKLQQQADFIKLYIDNYVLESKLIIGADGADSWLRKSANMQTYNWDHMQSALVATICSEQPHQRTAMQRFAIDGPLAFLPLSESNLSSIVWTSSPKNIQRLMLSEPTDFAAELAVEFSDKLGALQLQGQRACFPLRMLHAKSYIADRVALIGDAVHVVHPLAGQGLNLGIMDAAALAEVVLAANYKKHDYGQRLVLRKYERWRKGHNLGTLAMVEGFKRCFALKDSSLASVRDLTMGIVNNLKPIKSAMVRFAMGLNGDLPASARKV